MEYTDTDRDEAETSASEEELEPAVDPETEYETEDGEDGSEEEFLDETPAPVKAGKYRLFSLVLFVLTAGGLFLALIGNVASPLLPSYYLGTSGLNNSLLGFFLTRMKELFTGASALFSGGVGPVLRHTAALLAALLALAAVIVSAVCLIVTLASPKRAKTATAVGGAFSLLSYTLLVWAYCVKSLSMEAFGADAIDVPVAIVTGLLFVVLTVFAILENGKKGVFGAGIYIFLLAACFAFFFPNSFTESGLLLLKTFKEHPIYNLLSLATAGMLVVCLAVSTLATAGKQRGILRCILNSVLFVLALLLAVTGCGLGGVWNAAFFKNGSLLPSLILLIAPLGASLLGLLLLLVSRRERARAALAEYEEDEEDTEYYGDGEESDEESDEDSYEDSSYEDEEEHSSEMSDFEREMLGLTRTSEEAEEESDETPTAPRYQAPPAQPTYRPVTVYTDPSTQYTYDPFINELTPEEKDEFGDLFIACKSGKFGDLPVYHIGGDNAEFFDKVWIRYGMYDMSQNLREKLFAYLRRYRSNR